MRGRDYIELLNDRELAEWIRKTEMSSFSKTDIYEFLTTEEPYRIQRLARIGPPPADPEEAQTRHMYMLKGKWEQTPIQELEPTVRAYSVLYSAGIKNIGQLIGMRSFDIKRLRNCGLHTAEEISMKLERLTGYKMPL